MMKNNNAKKIEIYDQDDDLVLDLAVYWNKDTYTATETVCPDMFSHEMFGQALAPHKHYDLMVPLINAALRRNVDVSGDKVFEEMVKAFPHMFATHFKDFIIPKKAFVKQEFDLHPFDMIVDGECVLGEFEIIPDEDYSVSAEGWHVECGFMRPDGSQELFFGLVEALRPFVALNSLVKQPASDSTVWMGVANHKYLPHLNIHVDHVHRDRKARSVVPTPKDVKISPITFLYQKLESLDVVQRRYITAAITNGAYDALMKTLKKDMILRTCEGVVYSHMKVDPSSFERPTIPQRIDLDELVWLINWFNSLKDPFGPMWYTGVAFGSDVKVVFENVNAIMRLITYLGKRVEVLHLKKKEPTVLSLPEIGQDADIRVISTSGTVNKLGREGVSLYPSVISGELKSVISFEVEPFPSFTAKVDTMVVQTLLYDALEGVILKYSRYDKCAIRVDYRFPLYIGKDSKCMRYRFVPDADPMSKYVWFMIGCSDQITVEPSAYKAIYIRALQFRIDFMVFRMLNRRFVARFYHHKRVKFLFKQKKVDLTFKLEKEDLDGILDDASEEIPEEEVGRNGKPLDDAQVNSTPKVSKAPATLVAQKRIEKKATQTVSNATVFDSGKPDEDPADLFGKTAYIDTAKDPNKK